LQKEIDVTPRERVIAILKGEKPDQVPWFGDLDYWATALIITGKKPQHFKEKEEYIQWHRNLGVGFYLQGYYPFKTILENCEERGWRNGHRRYREIATPKGTLRECWEYLPGSFTEAPVEHLVKSEKDLAPLRYIYENIHYEPDYAFAVTRLKQIGEQGVLVCYVPKTPFMQLVAQDAGIVAVTFSERNAPEEFSRTLNVMKKSYDSAVQIALRSPAEILMIPENLSSDMVGPSYFETYMRTCQEEWITDIRHAGKFSLIHMDGRLRGLLREEASTGINVLEALTPKPVGDLAVEDWSSLADNPKTVLWGGIPGIYFTPLVDEKEFEDHVITVLGVMKQEARYVLGVADQVPPDGLERRVKKVSELVKRYGTY
jgi:hypothetical protein